MYGHQRWKEAALAGWLVYRSCLATTATTTTTAIALLQCDPAIGLQRFDLPQIASAARYPDFFLPYAVFVDLAFRRHFDPTAIDILGEPDARYLRIPDYNPCLRVQVKVVLDHSSAWETMVGQNGYFHDESEHDIPNSTASSVIRTHAAWYGDLLPNLAVQAGQVADALGIVYSCVNLSPQLANKELHPNFFRESFTVGSYFQAYWEFYKLYAWRAFIVMYTPADEFMGVMFEMFIQACGRDNVHPSFIHSASLSMVVPFQAATIFSQLKVLRQSTARLVFFFLGLGVEHFPVLGRNFNSQIYLYLTKIGLWLPSYQMVGGTSLSDIFAKNASLLAKLGTSYGATFGADSCLLEPREYALLLPNLFWAVGKATLMAAVDMNAPDQQERYGMDKWPKATLQSVLQLLNAANGMIGLLFTTGMIALRQMFIRANMNSLHILAHNCFLGRGGVPAVRNASLYADCLRTVSRNHSPLLIPLSFDDDNVLQNFVSMYGAVYVFDATTNTSVQELNNPIVRCESGVCSKGGRYAGYPSPVWANGIQSDDTPLDLLNCTPGMFMNSLGNCEWCKPGHYSNTYDAQSCTQCPPGKSAAANSAICNVCSPGKYSELFGSESCRSCLPGSYAKESHSVRCLICPRGKFSTVHEATRCQKCQEGNTTESMASAMAEDCVCPKSSYASQGACIDCIEGLACEEGWPRNWASLGLSVQLQSNYYSLRSAPYSTYLCLEEHGGCPGGPVEFCNNGRAGFLCSKCAASNYHLVGASCEPCPSYMKIAPHLFFLASILFIILAYYLVNGDMDVNADHSEATFMLIGLLVTALQILGVFRWIGVPWPKEVSDIMEQASFYVTFGAGDIPLSCVVGQVSYAPYAAEASMPFILCILTMSVCMMSRVANVIRMADAGCAWSMSKTFNVGGQISQTFFIVFSVNVVQPLQCYTHPNSMQSVVKYPAVLCWDGLEHSILLLVATIVLTCFLIPFLGWCLWACWKAPDMFRRSDQFFSQAFRFLMHRFRPDCWWWGIVNLLRQLILALAIVLPSTNAHARVFYTSATLGAYALGVTRFWPWISSPASILDISSSVLLLFLIFSGTLFLSQPTEHQGRLFILLALFWILAGMSFRFLFLLVRSIFKNGLFAEFNHHKVNREEVCSMFLVFLETVNQGGAASDIGTLYGMNVFDRRNLTETMDCWTTYLEGAQPSRKSRRLTNLGSTNSNARDANNLFQALSVDEEAVAERPSLASSGYAEHDTQNPTVSKVIASHGELHVTQSCFPGSPTHSLRS